MKHIKLMLGLLLFAIAASFPLVTRADHPTNDVVKPYPLKTCLVCGMELGMMDSKPYVFTNKQQEIKVCDESEKATFEKAPAKYLKKLTDAEAKLKK